MLDRLIAKSEANDIKTSAPEAEKKYTYEVLDARPSSEPVQKAPTPTWSFSNIPLFPSKDGTNCGQGAANVEAEPNKDGHQDTGARNQGEGDPPAQNKAAASHDRASCADKTCALCAKEHEQPKDRARASSAANDFAPAQNKCAKNGDEACNCKKCSGASDRGAYDGGSPAQDGPYTYTFQDRDSYGVTTPNFTEPRCAPGGQGSAVLQAGYALPNVTVYPTGTYRVLRNDGVVQTARCTRLAAGLAATRTHENSHAAGARRAAAAGNRAAQLPKNFATAAECTAALPAAQAAYAAARDPIWSNEVVHGPGTNQPTAQTFTAENAAGTCTFS
jgi:hypothetical protein